MKLLVGLGNPGRRYAGTRHNVGARIVERLAERRHIALDADRFEGRFGQGVLVAPDGAPAEEVGLLLPATWMNRSGRAVCAALGALALEDPARDLLVAYDDVDLPFGRLRLRAGGSAGGQRGLADVIERLERSDVPRLRFGVGRPTPSDDAPVPTTTEWVLRPFDSREEAALVARGGGLDRAAEALACFALDGIAEAMNRYNAAE